MGTNKTAIVRVLIEPAVPNEKTMKAIRNSRAGKGRSFSTAEELLKDLGISDYASNHRSVNKEEELL